MNLEHSNNNIFRCVTVVSQNIFFMCFISDCMIESLIQGSRNTWATCSDLTTHSGSDNTRLCVGEYSDNVSHEGLVIRKWVCVMKLLNYLLVTLIWLDNLINKYWTRFILFILTLTTHSNKYSRNNKNKMFYMMHIFSFITNQQNFVASYKGYGKQWVILIEIVK